MFAVPAVKVTTALPAPVTGPVKAYVPLLPKVNVAPLATENDPTAVLILERDSVPAFTATVPPVLLLKGTETVLVAVPPVFSKVPLLFRVRGLRVGSLERVVLPLALVVPVPLMVPPDQVSAPLTVTVSLPVNVPVSVIVVPTLLPAVPLRVSVPPVIDSAFTNSAPSLTVRGPVVKVMLALLTRFVMV